MIVEFKKSMIHFFLRFNNCSWTRKSAFKVLIQTNSVFKESNWQNIINEKHFLRKYNVEIQYTDSKLSFLKLFSGADSSFSFGLSNQVEMTGSRSKYLYFATVGHDFLKDKSIPENYQIDYPAGISSGAIAEYVLTMALLLNRKIFLALNNQSRYLWCQETLLTKPYRSLDQLIIGIFGLGENGKSVAKKFKEIGCRVFGCDFTLDKSLTIDKWFHADNLVQMLTEVDLLVICVPLTEKTKGVFDFHKLSFLGVGSYLINISRGEVVVEEDLVKALDRQIIGGAAIDVCTKEPLPSSNVLWHTPNLIITPHIAGNINLFTYEIMDDFIEKISRYIENNV